MKKHLANIISSTRITGAIVLFFQKEISPLFLLIYVLCGFTDLIDGPIARKTGATSTLGATLDSIGDVMTYLALTKILISQKLVPTWILAWIISSAVVFAVDAVISKVRFKKFYLPHTYLGKIFGGSVFLLPLAMQVMPHEIWMAIICTIASIHAIELLYVQSKIEHVKDFVPWAINIKKISDEV